MDSEGTREREREKERQTDREKDMYNLVFFLIQSFKGSLLMILISWVLTNFWKTKQKDSEGTRESERKRAR
jgi:hypothetical protein